MTKEVEIPVKDRSGDRWIRIIGVVSMFTFPLIGIIGGLILDNMDKMAERQAMTINTLHEINISIGTYGGRISRAEKDIEEISVEVRGINQRVYKLEGKNNGF